MKLFVEEHSIVRKIWGNADTILFIFSGAAAEFALNKAVDWLYFTGQLPKDPLGRLFSTVMYAKKIIFADAERALHTIDSITAIHKSVEGKRGTEIPDWAYRDVLFMLIDYSIRSFEILNRPLLEEEKEAVFDVFKRVGNRMGLRDLPTSYRIWLKAREDHMDKDLQESVYTRDLFKQYRKHLGIIRYFLLIQVQKLLLPEKVRKLLQFKKKTILRPVIFCYKIMVQVNLDKPVKAILLPSKYKKQIADLDVPDS